MAVISGKWQWNDNLVLDLIGETDQIENSINFTSNNEEFTTLTIIWSTGYYSISYNNQDICEYGEWDSELGLMSYVKPQSQYRIIDFGEEEQTISDTLFATISGIARQVVLPNVNTNKMYTISGGLVSRIGLSIREALGEESAFVFEQSPEKISQIYDLAYDKAIEDCGQNGVYDTGYSDGIQAEYDRFWDAYQHGGGLQSYEAAFAGGGWTNETFKPKYPIITSFAYNMFYACRVTDGYEYLKNADFSNCTFMSSAFAQSHFVHIGVVDCSSSTSLASIFSHVRGLKTIDKIIVNKNHTFPSAFINNIYLEDVTFEGEIGNDLEMAGTYSGKKWGEKLTKASIESIINHLSDSVTGKIVTLSKTAVDQAFETVVWDEEANNSTWLEGSSTEEWAALRQSKSNWTITLV